MQKNDSDFDRINALFAEKMATPLRKPTNLGKKKDSKTRTRPGATSHTKKSLFKPQKRHFEEVHLKTNNLNMFLIAERNTKIGKSAGRIDLKSYYNHETTLKALADILMNDEVDTFQFTEIFFNPAKLEPIPEIEKWAPFRFKTFKAGNEVTMNVMKFLENCDGVENILLDKITFIEIPTIRKLASLPAVINAKVFQVTDSDPDNIYYFVQKLININAKIQESKFDLFRPLRKALEEFAAKLKGRVIYKKVNELRIRTNDKSKHILIRRNKVTGQICNTLFSCTVIPSDISGFETCEWFKEITQCGSAYEDFPDEDLDFSMLLLDQSNLKQGKMPKISVDDKKVPKPSKCPVDYSNSPLGKYFMKNKNKLAAEKVTDIPKYSTNWCDLPVEMRSECIKRMDFKTRTRIGATSHTEKSLVDANKHFFKVVLLMIDDNSMVVRAFNGNRDEIDLESINNHEKTVEGFLKIMKTCEIGTLRFRQNDDETEKFKFWSELEQFAPLPIKTFVSVNYVSANVMQFLKNSQVENIILDGVYRNTPSITDLASLPTVINAKVFQVRAMLADRIYPLVQKLIDINADAEEAEESWFQPLRKAIEAFATKLKDRVVYKKLNEVRLRTNDESKHILIRRNQCAATMRGFWFACTVIPSNLLQSEYKKCMWYKEAELNGCAHEECSGDESDDAGQEAQDHHHHDHSDTDSSDGDNWLNPLLETLGRLPGYRPPELDADGNPMLEQFFANLDNIMAHIPGMVDPDTSDEELDAPVRRHPANVPARVNSDSDSPDDQLIPPRPPVDHAPRPAAFSSDSDSDDDDEYGFEHYFPHFPERYHRF